MSKSASECRPAEPGSAAPTEMELRVAKAICAAPHNYGHQPFERLDPDYQNALIGDARAAIKEMREPTEEMVGAGFEAQYEAEYDASVHDYSVVHIWKKMMDAATR